MTDSRGLRYKCPKCNGSQCAVAEMRATGGFWAKIFNIQNRRFSTVTCSKCKYTELFEVDSSGLGNVFDFFTN